MRTGEGDQCGSWSRPLKTFRSSRFRILWLGGGGGSLLLPVSMDISGVDLSAVRFPAVRFPAVSAGVDVLPHEREPLFSGGTCLD